MVFKTFLKNRTRNKKCSQTIIYISSEILIIYGKPFFFVSRLTFVLFYSDESLEACSRIRVKFSEILMRRARELSTILQGQNV